MAFAWGAVRRNPRRSALTTLGIGLATGLVILLLALSAGIESSSARLAVASGVDLLATSANTSLSQGSFPPIPDSHALTAQVPSADPNVVTASPWLIGELAFANASLYAAANRSAVPGAWSPASSGAVGWIPSENGGLETPALYNGTGFRYAGDPHFANGTYTGPSTHEVELDQGLATLLHVGPGSLVWAAAAPPSGPRAWPAWFANATAFRVVGISGPFWLVPSALLAFFYLSELQSLLPRSPSVPDPSSLLLIHLANPQDPSADQARLAASFPHLSVFTLGNILGAVRQVVDLYRTFGTLVGLVGVAVAVLFTTTVLLMSVDDRSREIALLRALGYTRRSIAWSVALEAALLCFLGLAVGLAVGLLGAYGMNLFLVRLVSGLPNGFSFVAFDPSVLAGGLEEVLLIALLASALPIARALSVPIAEELRAP
jgi:putative ABC transport system permease protein